MCPITRNNNPKIITTMAKKNKQEKHLNAKQRAYEKKQAQQGEKVVKWIFGVLILAALGYMAFTLWLMR